MTPSTTEASRRRLGDVPRRIIIAVLILGALVGIFLTGRLAITGGNEASGALPESVDRLIPASGSEVLRQSQVGIDVADGFDAYLQINGVEVRTAEDGLIKDLGTGLILFQPGPDRPVEELNPNQNCVTAFVFDQLEGPTTAQPVTWCFQAT
ncbi:MAG: hypothetical protein V9E94_17345 [Microthrixaceae bacterium]